MADELKLALVAALSAVAGTIVGGMVAYFTNKDLQDREFERSDRTRLIQAQSAASVELHRLVTARNIIVTMTKTGYYPPVRDRLRDELSTTEHQLVISYLTRERIDAYAKAMDCLNDLQDGIPSGKGGEPVDKLQLVSVRSTRRVRRRRRGCA